MALLILFTSFFPVNTDLTIVRENTPGTVSFQFKTQSQGGSYAPRHVLAVWMEKDGEFVKTRKAMANQRKQYLYTWKAASNYNVVDAITGSTLNSHQTHTIQWDCTDLDGNVVEDGLYTLFVEFTEKHAQGPLFSIEFEKASDAIILTPPDEDYFKNMEFSYQPEVTLIADFTVSAQQSCTDETLTFTDNSTGATSWNWDFGADANPATANTQGPHQVSYSATGNKTVTLTINQSITNTKPEFINVLPDAFANFEWTGEGRTLTFTNLSTDAVSYLWGFGDGTTSSETNPVHTYAEDGTYDVLLVANSEFCESSAYLQEIIINTVGLSESGSNPLSEIFPNPGNGQFYFTPKTAMQDVFVTLFTLEGRIISTAALGNLSAHVPVLSGKENLQSGIYFIQITSAGEKWQKKLFVK
jgi:PKD repeat protein